MASFMDNEAVESEDEDISDDEERARAKKTKRPKALSSDEDEDEDEDEDRVREEMRGFIADDDEEDDGSDSGSGSDSDDNGRGSSSRKRRRSRGKTRSRSRSRSENEDIDEEDMDLIEENLGIRLKKARKRIKMGSDEDSGDEGRERDDLPDVDADRERSLDEDDLEDDDNFIVDEHGRPLKKDRKKKKHHVFSDSALQLADDIFTVAVDYDLDDDDEEEDYDSEDETDEDDIDGERLPRRKKKKKRPTKTIFDEYEPDELAKRHYTDRDNEIRNTDIPERMQLREPPVIPLDESTNEIQEEGAWILKYFFLKPTLSQQPGFTSDVVRERERQPLLLEKIRNAVEYIRQGDEPPFIAFYRKEYVTPELGINDLWKIFNADGLWCKMQHQKRKLSELYDKMRLFQAEKIMDEPDKPLPEDLRLVTTEDIERVHSVETFEELKDLEQHFKLYYGRDTQAMQEWSKKKRKEDRENNLQSKKYRKKSTKTVINDEGDEVEVTDDDAEDDEMLDQDLDDENHNASIKQARKNDQYSLCLKNGLGGIVKRFGLSAEHFGENLLDGYTKNDVEQDPFDPLEVAADFVDQRRFSTAENVLSAAKFMVATQLSKDPKVIKVCRNAMHQRGFISIKPTKQGLKVIDEAHDCYTLKYIKDKPINTLRDDQWLRLIQAEQQKLIEIELANKIPGIKGRQSLVEEAAEYFSVDGYSKAITGWNKLRKECVEIAMERMLLPSLRKELRIKLEREAKEGVLTSCKAQLHDWLKIGKYDVEFEDEDEDDWGTTDGVRVMGVMYDPDVNVAGYAVAVSADGEMESFAKLENLLKRINSFNPKEKQEKAQDLEKIKKFILANKPHCIVVGVADRTGLDVKRDVENVVMDLVNSDAQFPRIGVFAVDDNLAKLYANSSRAEQDFRDFPNVFRQAISLARRIQDPLIEFSQLCGTENEITCLRYHPYQDSLSQEELLEGLSLELVNRTCEVGIDINKCVAHNHMSNLVQFVGGLGPRKGAALLKTLRQMQSSQRLENRQQLVTLCHMGPKVLINCAGFIKIDTLRLGDSEVYVEVLDGSRIHNEAYEWARKMAVDALEYDEEEGNPANALDEILQEPEKLAELDLDAFAEELERQGFGKKHITLQDIRRELHHMYKDLRDPFKPADVEDLFNMVTKESPKTFYVGKIVQARITNFVFKPPKNEELDKAAPQRKGETNLWQCPFCGSDDFPELTEVWNHFDAGTCPGKAIGIRIRLDNGVTGFIAMKNLSDSQIINPAERVKIGQIISCRIMKMNIERFTVDCVSKSSALQDKNNEWRLPKDNFYDYDAESKDVETEEITAKQKKRHAYMKRVIHHPNFYNISFKDAEKKLEALDLGDAIFRPSSKGENHLTVTWKIANGIYHHVDIKEEKKANAFSLGQSLWIGNEEYEALDEIIARFINPMAQHAKEIMDFKNYKDTNGGKRSIADDLIIQEKKAQPNKIHYFFSASQDFPGKFMLTYIPRETPKHEYVTVTPEGFKFRQQNFETLGQLMRWFKEHFRDKIPGGTPVTPGRLTGRTPYLNATPGGITPGAMSMAAGTPYAATPLSMYGAVNTPYTPSGQTPMLTPYATPGTGRHAHSATPKGYTGSTTPRYNPRPTHSSSKRGDHPRNYKDSTPLYDE